MNRDLILVAIALFTWGAGESAYFFFQPLYLEQLGASPVLIGTILGGVGIGMTVAHIPAGYLADRFGRRIMMWAAWFLGLAAGLIMAVAQTLPVFTAGVLLYGVTIFVSSPMNSYVTAARGKLSVGRALTITSAAYNAGAIIGPLMGGFIGDRFGLSRIYWFTACVFFVSTCVVIFIRPQPVKFKRRPFFSGGILNPDFVRFLPLFFFAIFAMYLPQGLAPNYLQHSHSISIREIGSLGSIGGLGTVGISLGLGFMNPRVGFVIGQIATGLFAIFLWQGTGISWFGIGYFFLGGFKAARMMALASIGEIVKPENIGLTFGITETIGGIAMILAPPIAGLLYERNPAWIFETAVGLILISVLLSATRAKNRTMPPVKGGQYGKPV